jgi:hypothetical protein
LTLRGGLRLGRSFDLLLGTDAYGYLHFLSAGDTAVVVPGLDGVLGPGVQVFFGDSGAYALLTAGLAWSAFTAGWGNNASQIGGGGTLALGGDITRSEGKIVWFELRLSPMWFGPDGVLSKTATFHCHSAFAVGYRWY